MNRIEAIESIYTKHEDALFVLSNGLTSRESAFKLNKPNTFYLLHAMGEAFSVGLGLANSRPDTEVVVIDGDGNALMGLASLSMMNVSNLNYYILANGVYQTTGSQELPPLSNLPSWAQVVEISKEFIDSPNPPAPDEIWERFQRDTSII